MESYLLTNANILTFGESQKYIKDGVIYVGRGTVLDFGERKEMIAKHGSVSKRIDLKGKLVMPGFIDLHNHLYSNFFQNIPVNLAKVKNYNDFMNKFWWKLTDKLSSDGVYYSAVKGILNAVKSGVTTIFNLHSSPNCIEESLEDISEAFEELSMRGVLGYEISNRVSDEQALKMLEVNSNFIKSNQSSQLVTGVLGLYNPNFASDILLKKLATEMNELDCGVMLHLAETAEDDEVSIKNYKKYAIDRLNDYGLLTPKTILASANYIDDYEAGVLAKAGVSTVMTPSTTMYNGLEFAPLKMFIDKGVKVGFGSGGIYSSISEEAVLAHKILRSKMENYNIGNKEIAKVVMNFSKEIANKFVRKSIGQINLGAAADLVVIDYLPEYEINEENLHTHLIYGVLNSRIISTIINGNFVMKDYELVGIDEQEINEKYIQFAAELGK